MASIGLPLLLLLLLRCCCETWAADPRARQALVIMPKAQVMTPTTATERGGDTHKVVTPLAPQEFQLFANGETSIKAQDVLMSTPHEAAERGGDNTHKAVARLVRQEFKVSATGEANDVAYIAVVKRNVVCNHWNASQQQRDIGSLLVSALISAGGKYVALAQTNEDSTADAASSSTSAASTQTSEPVRRVSLADLAGLVVLSSVVCMVLTCFLAPQMFQPRASSAPEGVVAAQASSEARSGELVVAAGDDQNFNMQSKDELRTILAIGAPMAFSASARNISDLGIAIIVGRSSTLYLAAVSVSSIWTTITDVAMHAGLAQLSTLCSQAKGAGNLLLMGTWLQIYIVFCMAAILPLAALRSVTAPVLRAVGVDGEIADLAGVYTNWSQPALFFDLCFCAVKQYYASSSITWPDAVVDGVFLFINWGIVYTLVHMYSMGIVGAAVAVSVTRFMRTLIYVIFCWYMGFHRDTWGGWSYQEIFVWIRWKTLLALTIPAAIGGLAEELQVEVCAVLAARLGKAQTAAFSLVLNLLVVFSFTLGIAIGDATGIRVAHHLGAGSIPGARCASWVGIHAGLGIGIVLAVFYISCSEQIIHMASNDPVVQEQLRSVTWFAGPAIFIINAFFQIVAVLTKQGRAAIIGIVVPLFCWGAGLPISYFLSQTKGLQGVIAGLVVGYGIACLVLFVAYVRSDWPALVAQAQESAEIGPSLEQGQSLQMETAGHESSLPGGLEKHGPERTIPPD